MKQVIRNTRKERDDEEDTEKSVHVGYQDLMKTAADRHLPITFLLALFVVSDATGVFLFCPPVLFF